MSGMDDVLQVRDLTVRVLRRGEYSPLVEHVSFGLRRGRFTAMIGASGSGKTLVLKAVLGLLDGPEWRLSGDIVFCGEEGETCLLRRGVYQEEGLRKVRGDRIRAVLQGPDVHLHPSLSVGFQIAETRDGRLSPAEVRAALRAVELPDGESARYPHQFSQGQRQRILIAMALGRAELVVADEPTSALDGKTQAEIIALLKRLRREARMHSLLLVSHDLEAIRALLDEEDEILVLDRRPDGSVGIVDTVTCDELALLEYHRHPGGGGIHPLLEGQDFSEFRRRRPPRRERAPVLQVRGLRQGYKRGLFGRETQVLNGVDLQIEAGEWVGVTGPSGGGKTTLVQAVSRLLAGTGGAVLFRPDPRPGIGRPVDLLHLQPDGRKADTPEMRAMRRHLQVVFQDSASLFNPRLTIGEVLCETLRWVVGRRDEREMTREITELLLRLGICSVHKEARELLAMYPAEISGGERQRLALARVCLVRPALVIADEPFTDQDPPTIRRMLEIMTDMGLENGTAFLIVSHNVRLIAAVCDRLVRLEHGGLTSFQEEA